LRPYSSRLEVADRAGPDIGVSSRQISEFELTDGERY
jgi:hypothetical protein